MLHAVTVRTLALAACGWLLALDAAALTLGAARGAVLIGRPLELTIPVTLDAGDGDSPCAEADLFYGDIKVRAPSVRFDGGANRQGVLRLTSPQPVDEPMITVYLRVGCGQSFTRRFVMLSELPPEPQASAPVFATEPRRVPMRPARQESVEAAPRAAAPASPGATAAAPAPGPTSRRERRRREAAAAASTVAPAAALPGAITAPATTPAAPRVREALPSGAPLAAPSASRRLAATRKADGTGTGRPRLQLDLLDLAPERDPTLRLSTELNLPTATDPAARQNAATLWQALRRTPDENVQEGLRLQALERGIQSLRTTTQQNAAAVTQMRQQVEQARSERGRAWLLPVLTALLALLSGLAVWLWRRGRTGAHAQWFEGRSESSATARAGVPPVVPGPEAPPVNAAPAATARTGAGFEAGQGGTVRMVGVQELIDICDKADFYLSIGQPEQAIATLASHVHDQVETSPLAWMRLLELYQKCGLRAEFERLRAEFIRRFAAQVPDFEQFDQPTSSLENYGRALSRIVALWPSRRVLGVIEESIFRKPGLPGAEPFSLEAYRELLLLYIIARDIAPSDDGLGVHPGHRPTDVPPTSLQAPSAHTADLPTKVPDWLVAKGAAVTATPLLQTDSRVAEDTERLSAPPSTQQIDLDIDIDLAAPEPPALRDLPPLDFDTGLFDVPIGEQPVKK